MLWLTLLASLDSSFPSTRRQRSSAAAARVGSATSAIRSCHPKVLFLQCLIESLFRPKPEECRPCPQTPSQPSLAAGTMSGAIHTAASNSS